jgi:hypothetical protein
MELVPTSNTPQPQAQAKAAPGNMTDARAPNLKMLVFIFNASYSDRDFQPIHRFSKPDSDVLSLL